MPKGQGVQTAERPESEGHQDQLNKQVILDEFASVRREFRNLVEVMSEDDLARLSNGTKWTNRELLFHMLFGYLIVRTLVWFCRALSRLPPNATKPAVALMNLSVRPFNWINYIGSVIGAKAFSPRRMSDILDKVTSTLGRWLVDTPDHRLSRRVCVPTKWDPFFKPHMTIFELYHYPTQHFEFHKRQLNLSQ